MRGPTRPDPTQPDQTRPNPTRPRDAFEKLISLERVDRFTSGLLCSMSPFNKFRIWSTTIPAGACHGTWHVPSERVSETPSPSVTPRPLARLRSNLVCVKRPASNYFYISQRWGKSARAHVHTRLPCLANGWADCVQILCVTRDPFNKCFTHVLRWSTSARAHVHIPFPDLASGWADCVHVWCLATDPLDKSFLQVRGGMHLYVRTCTPVFHISQTIGRIALKLGVWWATS